MYQRPKPEETEEDILRLQDEFLKNKGENKVKTAATVVRDCGQEKSKTRSPNGSTTQCFNEIQDLIVANTFEAVPYCDHIGQVVENLHVLPPAVHKIKFNYSRGFPKAKRRDLTKTSTSGGSVFSQQFKKVKIDDTTKPIEINYYNTCLSQDKITVELPDKSYILTGPESRQIHVENIDKIKLMTESEVMEHRQQLINTMDPAIVSFLKSRRRPDPSNNKTKTIEEQNQPGVKIEEINSISEFIDQSNHWLHFDKIETNKLAWMSNIEAPPINKSQLSYEARFDFDGFLLPFIHPEMDEGNRILFHHGDEPFRPGYTLQELIQLSRSSIIRQKIIALDSIANILELNSTGVYDKFIDLPLEQLFFVLRFCLDDDNTPSVLNSAVKALRNLICSKLDEVCLDFVHSCGFGDLEPILAVDELVDDHTVNDQQLVESNLIKCLARSEILTRIRYILNMVRPAVETVVYCVEILTRLARDSGSVLERICKCEDLIASIVRHFVPDRVNPTNLNSSFGTPLPHALKLLRVLSCRSKKFAVDVLVEKHNIMDAIATYVSSDVYGLNANGLRLQSESMHLWAIFMRYNIGTSLDYFRKLYPVLLELLNYHLKHTNVYENTTLVRQGHVASLLNLIKRVNTGQFVPFLEQCSRKWIRQFSTLPPSGCCKVRLIMSSLFNCLSQFDIRVLDQLISEYFDKSPLHFESIESGSMFLNNYELHPTSPNLKNLQAAAWNTYEHVIPVIQSNSPISFISGLSTLILSRSDKSSQVTLLRHMSRYVKQLSQGHHFNLINNWFTIVESKLILNVLKMSVNIRDELDDDDCLLYYGLAVKSLCIYHGDQKSDIEFLLTDIIFNVGFYPSDVLLRNLKIGDNSTSYLEEIMSVYVRVLGLRVNQVHDCLALDLGSLNVVPLDWIYTPIIVLYSNHETPQTEPSDQAILNCLRWIVIYDSFFPELANSINGADRFCRIACVLLGSDNLFLNPDIHELLNSCLTSLTKVAASIDFDRDIQGLSSFQNFYIQLLEQYQGVSYGDVLFGNFVLTPLAQRHSVKWRKMLWSEYMGVVETFNVTEQQCVYPLDDFFEPLEKDLSLLKCYKKALMCGSIRPNCVLYKIAKHHIDAYVLSKKPSN